MGLIIENNVVKVDHDVKDHLITGTTGNPTVDTVGGLAVYGVFRRQFNSAKLGRQRSEKVIGDNCPLIYALKGKDGLSVEFASIKKLNESLPTIFQAMAALLAPQFDVIVSMPSSSKLAFILGQRLARCTGKPHIPDLFVKSSNAQAYASVANSLIVAPRSVPRDDAVDIRNVLKFLQKDPDQAFAAKYVKPAIRSYFVPLALPATPPPLAAGARVLLVDDLLSSGQTLKCAERLLQLNGFAGPHLGATWFSKVGK